MERTNTNCKMFRIDSLIPIDYPRPRTLSDITERCRLFGGFRIKVEDRPRIEIIYNYLFLTDGNQRAIWCAINSIQTILADEININPEIRSDLIERRLNRKQEFERIGVYSPIDFLRHINNPAQYKTNK